MSNPPFWPDQRKTVLWVGPPPAKPVFSGACDHHGLRLKEVTVDQVEAFAPESRALLLPVARADSAFMKTARVAAQQCVQDGVAIVLVMSNEAKGLEPPSLAEVNEYYKAFKKLTADGFLVVGRDYRWNDLAGELSRMPVQAGDNRSLTITGADVDGKKASLLRQAFYDYRNLHVEGLDGGKSGARTLRIGDGETPPTRRPFVAKLSTPEKIDAERSAYLLIEQRVPDRLYARLLKDRCRVGLGEALVVYSFLEHCDPLPARLNEVGIEYVDHLFDHTLGDLHKPFGETVASVPDIYGEAGCRLLRWNDALRAASTAARLHDGRVPGAPELRAMIEELPRHDHQSGTVHGDLHIGNLFVPAGLCEALIIDYGSVRSNAPVLVDPACLEVSLTFPPAFATAAPPAERAEFRAAFLAAYKYPLRPSSARQLQAALGARCSALVRRIREIAVRMDPNPTGYPIAVAACLLRFASHLESGSLANRGLAYELAAALFVEAGAAMHQRKAKRIGAL